MPYADIEWNDPIIKRCPVCKGTKKHPLKREYAPPRTQIYWNTPLTDEEKAELFTTLEVPPHVYDEEDH